MIIVIFKKFSSAKIKTFLATRILKQLLYSDSTLQYIWAYLSGLLLQLKSWCAREASHNPAFMGNCRTISRTFYNPSTQWMKEMRTWDWFEISSYCFFVWCEPSSLLRLKSQGARGVSQLFQLKLQSSGGVSHHPILWATTWLLVTHSLIYPVDECPFMEIKKWVSPRYSFIVLCLV